MADDVKRVEGNYTQQWKSIHSDLIRKYYLPDIYKTYGRGFDFLDFFTMIGKKGLAPSPTVRFLGKKGILNRISPLVPLLQQGLLELRLQSRSLPETMIQTTTLF